MSQQHSQLMFSFLAPRKKVTACFTGEDIVTDAGLLTVKEYDHKIGYLAQINAAIEDPRQPKKVWHEQRTQLAQRLYGIIAGYEDCNDHQSLRNDPLFKVLANHDDLASPLASQSTLSRLENRITSQDFGRVSALLIDAYTHTIGHGAKHSVILDLDTTEDRCHGQQQFCLFHAYYQNYVYLPLLIFEGNTGHLLSASLRTGQKPTGEEVVEDVKGVLDRLRSQHSGLHIRLRADAEFAAPDLYECLEAERVRYAIGITGWKHFQNKTTATLKRAQRKYRKSKRAQRLYGSFWHQAKSWDRRRRIVFKVEVNAQGINMRFVITNMDSTPHRVFTFYEGRGECENRIKELKLGFAADRLSCHEFLPNAFRLLLHALAYNLINLFRLVTLKTTPLAKAQIETLRNQLLKVGACVKLTCRRIWFYFSHSWPGRSLFRSVCHIIQSLPKLAPT